MKLFTHTLFFFLLTTHFCFTQVNWTKYSGNPLDTLNGTTGSWNHNVHTSSILYNADSSRFEMWFTAEVYDGPPLRIGFAKSLNGIDWSINPNPVLTPTPGTWDQNTVEFPCVIRENGTYKMWYAGASQNFQYKVGYATSSDGINWTKDTIHNPIFGAGTDYWEAGGVHGQCIMPFEGGYKIWYEGFEPIAAGYSKIGYATSVDGINWIRDTLHNPILGTGNSGEWDDAYVYMPFVLYIDSLYYLYYGGSRAGLANRQIGLATSTDGITQWTKHQQNPVLFPTPGEWDEQWVQVSRLLLVGDSLYMWYTGTRYPLTTYLWRIGLATSEFEPVSVEEVVIQPKEFYLEQNFPNPFNPSTRIKYSVPQTSQVQIKVFDVLGNEIETLVNEEKSAGRYEVELNAGNLPSGVYFYQLQAGQQTAVKKMLLLK